MNASPKVTFVTPNFNDGDLLPRMLQSTFDQDYPVHEVILIDDGSTDDSLEIIREWQAKHPEIKLLKNTENKGIVYSVNRGVQEAQGDLIVLRSADDVSYPGFLSKSIELLEQFPEAGFCCGDIGVFEENANQFLRRSHGWSKTPLYYDPEEFARIFCGSEFWGNSCVIRADAIREAGMYIEELKWSCDWFMYMVIAFRRGICYLPEVVAGMRYDEKSYCNEGVRDIAQHKQVCLKMLQLLQKEEFRDVLPFFSLSGCMGTFGSMLAEFVLREPAFWNPTVQALTWRNIGMLNEYHSYKGKTVSPTIKRVLNSSLEKIKKVCKARCSSIAIYGAGQHSEVLLREWELRNLPAFNTVIVTSEPEIRKFEEIPVLSICEARCNTYDLIVLSSKSFEIEMASKCKECFPSTPLLAFWNPELSSF